VAVSDLGLALRQVKYENKAFWRNPASAFFTIAFPMLFLVIFTTIFGNDTSTLPTGEEVSNSTYYTASILAFSVITACYTNIAIGVTFSRDEGSLKRIRGTPLPGWAYLLGRVLHSIVLMAILVVVTVAFGAVFYDVGMPTDSLPAFVTTLVVGSAAFCALGLACTAIIPNAEAAPAVVNASILPLLFISGVFFPIDDAPQWLQNLADVFPVRHFLVAAIESFIPPPDNPDGWLLGDLAFVAAWGGAGLLVAVRYFTWESRR
jgi:ABC-2 type transport system permease protein